jgi:hypothetical protein
MTATLSRRLLLGATDGGISSLGCPAILRAQSNDLVVGGAAGHGRLHEGNSFSPSSRNSRASGSCSTVRARW